MTDCEKVLEFMKNHGEITQNDAFTYFGCWRLASRICDLKKAGYNIKAEWREVCCRDGSVARVKAYSLVIPVSEEIEKIKEDIKTCEGALFGYYHAEEEGELVRYEIEFYEKKLEQLHARLKELEGNNNEARS